MRKLIVSLLLAGVATTPALAQRPDRADRQEARSERSQAREDRQEDRQQAREDRPQVREERQVREQRAERSVERPQVDARVRADAGARANPRDVQQIRVAREQANDLRQSRFEGRQQVRADRRETIRDNRQLRQSERPVPRVMHTRVPVVSNVPRVGTQPPPRTEVRHSSRPNWSSNWRHNSRYDWHNSRNRHRSIFHLGFYNDPFGWGYQPYSIGWRLWPNYYRSSFWINDPWEYRLPYAPPGTRWVRYYNDAILVDTWSGEVVDVIYSFFW